MTQQVLSRRSLVHVPAQARSGCLDGQCGRSFKCFHAAPTSLVAISIAGIASAFRRPGPQPHPPKTHNFCKLMEVTIKRIAYKHQQRTSTTSRKHAALRRVLRSALTASKRHVLVTRSPTEAPRRGGPTASRAACAANSSTSRSHLSNAATCQRCVRLPINTEYESASTCTGKCSQAHFQRAAGRMPS